MIKQYKIKLMHYDQKGLIKYDILEYTLLNKMQIDKIKKVIA